MREFARRADEQRARIEQAKAAASVPDYGWYPYSSLSAIPILAELFDQAGLAFPPSPVIADIGCADGDLAAVFAGLGAEVDAIDHAESNFNQLRGIEVLRHELAANLLVHDFDLDQPFELPRRDYSLALFLGTLYHLKNPVYVLEKIAHAADWCVLSTRIARETPSGGRIEREPLAYLLASREANNDPTNYWIFSAAGLLRLLERSGWTPVAHRRIGCGEASNPVDADRDERMFVIARSRPRRPELYVRPLEGWHGVENEAWRWTAKRFSLDVVLPASEAAHEFALRFTAPEGVAPLGLRCLIAGREAGSITCASPCTTEFRGLFPPHEPGGRMTLEFHVESSFAAAGDARELGVIVPVAEGLPFRIS